MALFCSIDQNYMRAFKLIYCCVSNDVVKLLYFLIAFIINFFSEIL